MLTVTIYTTGPLCGRCTVTKRALDKAGVPYTEVNVRENDAAYAYITDELGYGEAPVVVVEDGTGEDHWSGVRLDAIARVARTA